MYLLCLLWQHWFKSSLACQKIPIDSSSENDPWSILTSRQLYHSWYKFLYDHSYKCSIKLCGSSSLRCGEYFDYVQMFMQYIKTSPISIWRVRLGNSVLSFKLIHFFNINYVDSIYLVLYVKLLELGSEATVPSVTSTCNIVPRSCMLVMIWRYILPSGADIQTE